MAEIFRAYDIRGSYPDEVNETIAHKIGSAFVHFLSGKNIVVARDMRISSPALADAFVKGAMEAGGMVTDIGMTTTPMLYYAIIDGCFKGGAMVTASHLPAGINGFKLCRENAIPLSGEHGLPDLKKSIDSQAGLDAKYASEGQYKQLDYLEKYIDKLSEFVHKPKAMRIVVDVGNGIAGPEVTAIFAKFGAWELIPMYMNPDGSFPHHVANPLIESNTVDLQKKVVQEKADIGVAFDGDADRCGFIDEKGERIPEDLVTALIAESFLAENPGSAIVYDLRSSKVVPETVRRLGGRPVRCRVGHAFIKEKMREENAVFAGELSGHYYYRDVGFTDNAMFTMIWMLNYLASKDAPLSQLVSPLKKYYSTGEINIHVKDKEEIFEALENSYSDAQTDHLDGLTIQYDSWWFNLRPSNTEPVIRLNLEADDEETLKQRKEEVLGKIKNAEPQMQLV
ncbi:MAG: phosphomannomutase/phosphoglucomutase [Sedimentisphaerales bacterium]